MTALAALLCIAAAEPTRAADVDAAMLLVELREIRAELHQYHAEVIATTAALTKLADAVEAHQITLHGCPGEETHTGLISRQTRLESSHTRHSRFLWGLAGTVGAAVATGAVTITLRKFGLLKNGNGHANGKRPAPT